jgi:hypothetical protein
MIDRTRHHAHKLTQEEMHAAAGMTPAANPKKGKRIMRRQIRLGLLTASLLLATAGFAATASVAQAKPVPSGDITITASQFRPIRNVGTNKCLQPETRSTAEFARIVQNTCDGHPAQNWDSQSLGGNNQHRFLNQHSGLCFNAFDGVFNGARLLQVACKRISNEEFNTGRALPAVTKIESRVGRVNTDYCVDVPGGETTEGREMHLFRCNNTPAQTWVIDF